MTTPTIIILPGELKQSHFSSAPSPWSAEALQTAKMEFNWKKKTRFEEVEEDEMSSEGQVETTGIDKKCRSEHGPHLSENEEVLKRAYSF